MQFSHPRFKLSLTTYQSFRINLNQFSNRNIILFLFLQKNYPLKLMYSIIYVSPILRRNNIILSVSLLEANFGQTFSVFRPILYNYSRLFLCFLCPRSSVMERQISPALHRNDCLAFFCVVFRSSVPHDSWLAWM